MKLTTTIVKFDFIISSRPHVFPSFPVRVSLSLLAFVEGVFYMFYSVQTIEDRGIDKGTGLSAV